MTIRISVCLCTYRRESLMATLKGLAVQQLPSTVLVDIVVVDSDANGSAQPQIDLARAQLPITINSFVATRPGVAEARNMAVSKATGDWLAFIDDDEVPEPDWLEKLLACAKVYDAQVVFGEVRTLYPIESPDWIRENDLFGKSLAPTGTLVKHGPTCNTLLARAAIANETHIFDVAYGTTGGEDTEFFYRLSNKGVRMVTCCEAIVSETVEKHRLNQTFILKKAVRVGETYFRIFFADKSLILRMTLLFRASLQWFIAYAIAMLCRPLGLGRSMKYQMKAAANLGKIRAALGLNAVELYKG
jgi:succinoglycan biosynthesis protein ExoM